MANLSPNLEILNYHRTNIMCVSKLQSNPRDTPMYGMTEWESYMGKSVKNKTSNIGLNL